MIVRLAEKSDMNSVYMMGFDVWSEGETEKEYLDGCEDSLKYANGRPISFQLYEEIKKTSRKIESYGENIFVKIPIIKTSKDFHYIYSATSHS